MRRPALPVSVLHIAAASLLVAVGAVVEVFLLQPLGVRHPLLIYYPVVAVAAMALGVQGGLTATLLSVLSVSYFSLEPRSSLSISHLEDQVYVAVFMLEGCLITYAAYRVRLAKFAEAERDLAQARIATAQRVRDSEERLRLALEGATMGMWSWNVSSATSEWNDQEYELLGYPKGGGVESVQRFFDRVHPDDLEEMKRHLEDVLRQEVALYHEFRIVRPDGETRWIAARGKVYRDADSKADRMCGTNYDITALRTYQEEIQRAEREAQARAKELALLMDTVPAFTFIAHDPECRSMSGSRKSRELLQVPAGKSVSASAPEEDRPGSFRCFKDGRELAPEELPVQRAARGEEIHDYEFTLVRNDGTSCDLLGNAVPLRDDGGGACGAIGAFIDITEQKKIQRQLAQTRDELEERVQERTAELQQALETLREESQERIKSLNMLIHQSRLAALGEMVANIAHQWRQPINTLGLLVQELGMVHASEGLSEEYLTRYMTKARALIMHMSQTIDDFRNFFRPAGERSVFKVADMVGQTLTLVEDVLKTQQIAVHVEVTDDAEVYGHIGECCQVLLNLLMNSRDAFVEREREEPRLVEIKAFSEDARTVITVSDNAGGIREDILPRIFEPYFTTKDPEEGTGLGLFMARTIVESQMNGKFTVHNVGGGAEFRIEVASRAH